MKTPDEYFKEFYRDLKGAQKLENKFCYFDMVDFANKCFIEHINHKLQENENRKH